MRSTAKWSAALGPPRTRGEDGFAVIEVIVSAMVMVAIGGGALAALQASDRSVADERHHARAFAVAQQDQARMRSLKISELSNLNQTRTVHQDGTPYTVTSAGEYVTDSTGTANCATGTASADYIRISSSVSWPSIGGREPVLLQSIVAPPNGSISADHGALAVAVQNGQNAGLEGVGLSGTGAGSFSGVTGSNGCAIFGNLPEGNYTLTASGAGLVDRDGVAPQPIATSVVGLSTNTVVLQYDHPGSLDVSFTTRVRGSLVASAADQLMVFNTGMTGAKAFGTLGTQAATVTASPLFPFASPDTVYAGSCTGNNPNPADDPNSPGVPATASVVIPSGGNAAGTIQLPALNLKVWSGSSPVVPGSPINRARVTISDDNCDDAGGNPIRRIFATDSNGELPNPGLPTSTYDVCADNGVRRATALDIDLQNFSDAADFDDGTTLDLYVGGGSLGTCP